MRNNQTQLDAAMDARRVDLRMTWREVAETAELSLAGLSAIRRGERQPSTLTVRRIEDALQWEHGSIQAVLDGGDPTPVQAEEPQQYNFLERIERIRAELDKLQRDAEEQRKRGA